MGEGYRQYCALARTLDVAGDRWALLIVRELRPGPRRFTDLVDGLPGISRKLLTERLRDLERDRIVARTDLPPPAARQVYELTADGRDLADALAPLIAWGARRIGERRPEETFRPRWSAVGMAALADRDAAAGVSETYQYVVGDSAFYFVVDDGSVELRDGRAEDPAVVVTTDEGTWTALVTGETSASAAAAAGKLVIAGERAAAKRLGRIFARDRMLARGVDSHA
ncbi:MAG TPA: winged helix-turn-helix transcriptional regulator [Actinomycetota bacterium]|nr:winged helix-turn-helix transcriptional regulator [Actinomycetota bacterium]